jgi:sodium-dependent phosphate transporter
MQNSSRLDQLIIQITLTIDHYRTLSTTGPAVVKMPYTYVFAIGTMFAMLDAYNNGANDVANSWATSVSSRSISYRQAMVFGTIFETLGAVLVGARTADTIKNGIIPNAAFNDNAGVQMLAFTCALAAASSWVRI